MSTRKECPDLHEAIAALAMGILSGEEADTLRSHLAACADCRHLCDTMCRQEEDLRRQFDQFAEASLASGSPEVAPPKADGILEDICRNRPSQRPGRTAHPRRWLAIAAGLVVAAAGLFFITQLAGRDPFTSPAQASYTDILRQIADAHSVCYTKIVRQEGRPANIMRQKVLMGGRMRTEWADGQVIIDDFPSGNRLSIRPSKKTAVLRHSVQVDLERLSHYLEWISRLHEREGVYAGQETLAGQTVDVYRINQFYKTTTVWADPATSLPVRVETRDLPCTDKDIRLPTLLLSCKDFVADPEADHTATDESTYFTIRGAGITEQEMTITLTDFDWNSHLDESLFQLTPPPGYKLEESYDTGQKTDGAHALVESLRFWAQMQSGQFPENINMLADAKPLLIRRYRGTAPAKEAFRMAIPMGYTLVCGMGFAEGLKLVDNWHYHPQGVTLGQADRPVAWWLDKKTSRWQVIYGDLHMQDLPADRPPVAR